MMPSSLGATVNNARRSAEVPRSLQIAADQAALKYDAALGGYRTGITEQQLKDAPAFCDDAGVTAIGKLVCISTTEAPAYWERGL
jgi:hypothetical protein